MFDSSVLERNNPLASPSEIIKEMVPGLRYTANHEYVISQAQRRLKGYNQMKLKIAAIRLEELFRVAEPLAQDSAIEKLKTGSELEQINDPVAFIELFEQNNLDKKTHFQGPAPATYFALLALIYALESLEYLKRYEDPEDRERAAIQSIPMERAKEMIAFIQGMEFESIFRRQTSSSGNDARHATSRSLKEKIIEFADEHCAQRTHRDSARRAYRAFQHEVDHVLNTDDPEKRLEIWIGKHRREQRKEQRKEQE